MPNKTGAWADEPYPLSSSPQACHLGTAGIIYPSKLQFGEGRRRGGLPPPQAVPGLQSWGRGYGCGKLAEAAGSSRGVEKMISNPEKCRPDEGLSRPWEVRGREAGREGAPQAEKGRGARERAQELVWRKLQVIAVIPSFLHPQIFIEGLLSAGHSARL